MSKIKKVVFASIGAVSSLGLGACTSVTDRAGIVMLDRNHHVAGVNPIDGNSRCFEDLAFTASFVLGTTAPSANLAASCKRLIPVKPATMAANTYRNDVTKAMMMVSDARCGRYVQFLQTYQGNVSNLFGIGSQIASLIGTLTNGGTANAFAGIGGTVQGAGNTLTKNAFQDKALELIAAGFMKRRAAIKTEIDAGLAKADSAYDMAHAVSDAVRYHEACNLNTGFQELIASLNAPKT